MLYILYNRRLRLLNLYSEHVKYFFNEIKRYTYEKLIRRIKGMFYKFITKNTNREINSSKFEKNMPNTNYYVSLEENLIKFKLCPPLKCKNTDKFHTSITIYDKKKITDQIMKLNVMIGNVVLLNYKFQNNLSCVHYAALYNNLKIINLISNEKDYNMAGGKYGSTPLFFATYNRHYKLITHMLMNGAEILLNTANMSVIDICVAENDVFGLLIFVFYIIKNKTRFLNSTMESFIVLKTVEDDEDVNIDAKKFFSRKFCKTIDFFCKQLIRIKSLCYYSITSTCFNYFLGHDNIHIAKTSTKPEYLISTKKNKITISDKFLKINGKTIINRSEVKESGVKFYFSFFCIHFLSRNIILEIFYCAVLYKYLIKTEFFFYLTQAFILYLSIYDKTCVSIFVLMTIYLSINTSFRDMGRLEDSFDLICKMINCGRYDNNARSHQKCSSSNFGGRTVDKLADNFCYTCWIDKSIAPIAIKQTEYNTKFKDKPFCHKKTHHCSVCNKCFINSHHHCVFLGTCIDMKKISIFHLYVLYIIYLSLVVSTNDTYLSQLLKTIRFACMGIIFGLLTEYFSE